MEITDPAVGGFRAYARFWILLVLTFVTDQLTKLYIVELSGFEQGLYPPFDGLVVIEGIFNIVYAVNYGAAWGMMAGLAWLLIALALVVLAVIWFFRKSLALDLPIMQVSFGLMCGGIVGNTLDRILRGHVVDFIDIHLQIYRWPTFNVADSAIVVGTCLYIIQQFTGPKECGSEA